MNRAAILLGLALLVLAGCAVDRKAPYDEIAARAYVGDSPPSLTFYTVLSTRDGSGAHSSLLVNGPQRVLFDPAGSFEFPTVPERGDVLYGFTPRIQSIYIDFHARETYDVLEQKIEVSPEIAALALQAVQENGAVAPAFCTTAITRVLRRIPGFETIRSTPFPAQLSRQLARLPGVETRRITDDDTDDNQGVLIRARALFSEAELRQAGG